MGGFNRLDDIGGVTAGADAPGDVTRSAKSFYLFGKNIIEVIIVADAGQYGCVGRQGNGCQGRAFNLKAVDKFGRQVLGIRRAAAIAENEYFVAAPSTGNQHIRCLHDTVDIIFDAIPFGCDAGFQDVQDNFFH